MTAIDAAVQSKLLGADIVTIAYRRGVEDMKASGFERELAQTNGVVIRPWAQPLAIEGHGGAAGGVLFEHTRRRTASWSAPAAPSASRPTSCSPPSARRPTAATLTAWAPDSRAAASSSTTSGALRSTACGRAAIASPAASI